mmetsp:Transcript_14887/g.33595  ORF Transcript_14887/g.33595 Transcript_14887/m.33595 type:complete len:222 (-) Transcript_14887:151-816(-)
MHSAVGYRCLGSEPPQFIFRSRLSSRSFLVAARTVDCDDCPRSREFSSPSKTDSERRPTTFSRRRPATRPVPKKLQSKIRQVNDATPVPPLKRPSRAQIANPPRGQCDAPSIAYAALDHETSRAPVPRGRRPRSFGRDAPRRIFPAECEGRTGEARGDGHSLGGRSPLRLGGGRGRRRRLCRTESLPPRLILAVRFHENRQLVGPDCRTPHHSGNATINPS